MKVSLNWLREWVDIDLSPAELAHTLTMGGLEVDEISYLGEGLAGVVVARIESTNPHPDADRLRVCDVQGDSEARQIVCGAPNARPGLIAPLATVGTTMPNGMKIKPAKLRGVASEGMLCSAQELGLGEGQDAGAGLMELPEDAPIGLSLVEYLGLEDTVFDIDLTPNRADCLSVRGVARDLAALTGQAFHPPQVEPVTEAIDHSVPVHVIADEDCPAYFTRTIQGIDATATTPLWLSERLRRSGIRTISPVVDVTNYVLLELGQPMHAFDADKLQGKIIVRRAHSSESLTLLDGQTIDLGDDCLVIADDNNVLALAGVMGGDGSSVTNVTRNIVLESAWFSPAIVAGKARRFGLSSESAHRFERGVDPSLQAQAMERATELICSICGGQSGPIVGKVHDSLPKNQPIVLRIDDLNRLLGTNLGKAQVVEKLEALGMEVSDAGDMALSVIAPNARRDMNQPVDLIEEVARLVGYDELPARLPSGSLSLNATSEQLIGDAVVRQYFISRGFQEVLCWSFISKETSNPDGTPLRGLELANPLSQEQALMRPALLPGMLQVLARNARFGAGSQRLFELGHCFDETNETHHLGLAIMGQRQPAHYDLEAAPVDFLDLKGEVEAFFAANQLGGLQFVAGADATWLHPAQSANLVMGGRVIGQLGQLHPMIAEQYELKKGVFVAEWDIEQCRSRQLPKYKATSKFPSSRRDLALVIPDQVLAGDVLAVATSAGGELLEQCLIFDLYRGEGIEKGFKSIGIGLIIRDNSRTLVDRDVDAVAEAVMAQLAETFGATLRG